MTDPASGLPTRATALPGAVVVLARPAPLVAAKNPSSRSALDVVVTARGDQANAVLLTTTVSILGGSAPGRYALSVEDTIVHDTLQIAGWSVHGL